MNYGTRKNFVQKVVLEEELSFLRTLNKELNTLIITLAVKLLVLENEFIQNPCQEIMHFELSDTYGFPLDLTELNGTRKGMDS